MRKLTQKQFETKLEKIGEARSKKATPFENDTTKEKKARKKLCKKDFFSFCHTYFPHYMKMATPDFHREWDELAEIKNDLVCIGAPRGHAKSSILTLLKPLWWIIFKKRNLIIIGSQTATQAERFSSFIKAELDDNARLIGDYGKLEKRGSWTAGEFITKNGVMVVALGKGVAIRGIRNREHRPDALLVDDVENDKEQKNPDRIKETIAWIVEAAIPAMADNYSAMFAGNLLSTRSALAQLIAKVDEETGEPLYPSRVYRALSDDNQPLWIELFSLARLLKLKKKMGSKAFNKEYQNLPTDDESMFQEANLVEWDEAEHTSETVKIIMLYTDPSVGATAKHDMKATVALTLIGKKYDCLWARVKNESVPAMINGAFDIHDSLRELYPNASIHMAFEANGFQELLRDDFYEMAEDREISPRVIEVTNSINKIVRIENLDTPFELGRLRFKPGHSDQNRLLEQMYYLESGVVKDDGPDACSGAYIELKKLKRKGGINYESLGKRRGSKLGDVLGNRHETQSHAMRMVGAR